MRSVENARSALDDGDFERAIKMMNSTDQLCSKVVAPPTVHGLAMRVLSDAYVKKGVWSRRRRRWRRAWRCASLTTAERACPRS